MYRIGELSRLCHIPVKTLRYYDSIGLLPPDRIDRYTGYRYYSPAKLGVCHRILAMKSLGFSLEEIRQQLSCTEAETLILLLAEKIETLTREREAISVQLKQLTAMKETVQGEKKVFTPVLQAGEQIRAAVCRRIYRGKAEAMETAEKIRASLSARSLGSRTVLISYESEYREEEMDLAACVEIREHLPIGSAWEEAVLTLGEEVATLACRPEEIEDAYRGLIAYVHDSDRICIGAFYEIRHGDGTVEVKVPVTACVPLTESVRQAAFEDDPDVLGEWRLLDIVPTETHFVYGHPKCDCRFDHKELYFLPQGEGYWIYSGWTRGELYMRHDAQPYKISEKDGHRLLFLTEHVYREGKLLTATHCKVYEKIRDAVLSASDIALHDDTDLPILPDPSVVGEWTACDFFAQYTPERFDPAVPNRTPDSLYLRSLTFAVDGSCTMRTKAKASMLPYTKGIVLNPGSKTASAYEIRTLDGQQYLFFQWKSGDYIYGGGRINLYVLRR